MPKITSTDGRFGSGSDAWAGQFEGSGAPRDRAAYVDWGVLKAESPMGDAIDPPPGDGAAWVQNNLTSTFMQTSSVQSVTVRMRNVGTTTWTGAYELREVSGVGWAPGVAVVGTVIPGQEYSFTFNITAPGSPGTYGFSWRMHNGTSFFGEASSPESIVVDATVGSFDITATPNQQGGGISYTYIVALRDQSNTVVMVSSPGVASNAFCPLSVTPSYGIYIRGTLPVTIYGFDVYRTASGCGSYPSSTTGKIFSAFFPGGHPSFVAGALVTFVGDFGAVADGTTPPAGTLERGSISTLPGGLVLANIISGDLLFGGQPNSRLVQVDTNNDGVADRTETWWTWRSPSYPLDKSPLPRADVGRTVKAVLYGGSSWVRISGYDTRGRNVGHRMYLSDGVLTETPVAMWEIEKVAIESQIVGASLYVGWTSRIGMKYAAKSFGQGEATGYLKTVWVDGARVDGSQVSVAFQGGQTTDPRGLWTPPTAPDGELKFEMEHVVDNPENMSRTDAWQALVDDGTINMDVEAGIVEV